MNIFQKAKLLLGLNRIFTDAVEATKKEGGGMETKNVFTSKTFIFNAAIGLLGFIQQAGLISVLPEPWGPALAQLFASTNILLRYYTNKGVTILPVTKEEGNAKQG